MTSRVKVPCLMNFSFLISFPDIFRGTVASEEIACRRSGFAAATRSRARCTRTLLPSTVEVNSMEPHSSPRIARRATPTRAFTDIGLRPGAPRAPRGRRDASSSCAMATSHARGPLVGMGHDCNLGSFEGSLGLYKLLAPP